MERPSVLMVVADEDRPQVGPIVEAIAGRRADVVDDAAEADVAVLIASPDAAASTSVDRSLAAWTEHRPASEVIVVLLGGVLEWNPGVDAFDPAVTTALSPAAQRLFANRPLWLDGRAGIDDRLATRVAAAVPTAVRPPAPGHVHQTEAPPQMRAPTQPPAPRPMQAPTPPAPPPMQGLPRTRIVVLAGLALAVVAVVVVFWARRGLRPSEVVGPPDPSSPAAVPILLVGIGLGIGLAVLASWLLRRRKSRRPVEIQRLVPHEPAERPTVFISHDVDADHALAVRLARDLGPDVDVWMAPESIEPGEPWLTSVERGLGLSRVFLALLSRASLTSPWVVKEIQAAMELEVQRRLRLVPVQIEECDIPILLRTYQIMRLAGGYSVVVDQARRLATRPQPPPATAATAG